jgi:RHH-type proline utilization regulon transcriptional repressor/proline dehydrogenase/delta 1-pyrroline-5-carboxylate dehydrogenase
MPGFPVFTHKWATDVAYLTLARRVLASAAPIYPQFASHNALTVAAIVESAHELARGRSYEFQRLHGMGEPLYDALLADSPDARVRVYAPVGAFRDLLAYLVRRLLENGSNTSFVHQITDRSVPAGSLVADPYEAARRFVADPAAPASALPTGRELSANAAIPRGIDLQQVPTLLAPSGAALTRLRRRCLRRPVQHHCDVVLNPARLDQTIGSAADASTEEAMTAIGAARAAMPAWDALGVDARAAIIERVADAWEEAHDELVALIVREGGRTMLDAHLEVREAIDFCRYYAACGRTAMQPQRLPGPVGESNELRLAGRGVFVCISPWNFRSRSSAARSPPRWSPATLIAKPPSRRDSSPSAPCN